MVAPRDVSVRARAAVYRPAQKWAWSSKRTAPATSKGKSVSVVKVDGRPSARAVLSSARSSSTLSGWSVYRYDGDVDVDVDVDVSLQRRVRRGLRCCKPEASMLRHGLGRTRA
jgi:hypothetical protein